MEWNRNYLMTSFVMQILNTKPNTSYVIIIWLEYTVICKLWADNYNIPMITMLINVLFMHIFVYNQRQQKDTIAITYIGINWYKQVFQSQQHIYTYMYKICHNLTGASAYKAFSTYGVL